MNIEAHLRSIAHELDAQKDRVRNIIADRHWQTDGEWRESILRGIFRRHLPEDVKAVRGLVTTGDGLSTQIDILLYDSTRPTLYREQDLVIVTPDSVLGIIEVKSHLTRAELARAGEKLISNALLICPEQVMSPAPIMVGLFSYSVDVPVNGYPTWILDELAQLYRNTPGGVISQLCFGNSIFAHYWDYRPGMAYEVERYDHYHLYDLDGMAPGYFVNNVIQSVAPESVRDNFPVWFPEYGKEWQAIASIAVRPPEA